MQTDYGASRRLHRKPCYQNDPNLRCFACAIEDDLAGLLKRRARELGVPFNEAVNRTIWAGLGEQAKPGRGAPPKTIPHSFGFRPGVDLDRLNQLADEL